MYKNKTITTNYTLEPNIKTVLVNAGSSNVTITIPDPSKCGERVFDIMRFSNTDTGSITITPTTGNIQNPTNKTLTNSITLDNFYQGLGFTSDSVAWHLTKINYDSAGNTSLSGTIAVTTNSNMKALTGLTNNQYVKRLGYYSINDGGDADYIWDSSSTATDDGGSIIALSAGGTGRFKLVLPELLSFEVFGAKGDGVYDDTVSIQNSINYLSTSTCKKVVGKEGKTYLVSSQGTKNFMTSSVTGLSYCLDIPSGITVDLMGSTIKSLSDAVIISNRNSSTNTDNLITLTNGILDGGGTLITNKPFLFFYGVNKLTLKKIKVQNTTHLISTLTNISNSFFDELIAENIVGNGWQFGLPTNGQEVRDSVIGKIYAYNISPESEPIVPGNPFLFSAIRCSIELLYARNVGSGIKIQPNSSDLIISLVDIYQTNNVNYNSGFKIQGDSSTKVKNITVSSIRSSLQRGCGLFIEYAENILIGKYIGENNAIDGSYPDVWVSGDRVEIQSIFSNNTGGIGVLIRTDAKDYSLGNIFVLNAGNATNSSAVQVSTQSRGIINNLLVTDNQTTKTTTLGINISSSDAVGVCNNLIVQGLGASQWLGNISQSYFINNLRLTTAQRNDMIIPAPGTEYFDTTTNRKVYYNGTSWTTL